MKLFKPLFLKYLLRQQLISLIVSFIICTITSLLIMFTGVSDKQDLVTNIILFTIAIIVWVFPIYLLIMTIITYHNLIKEKSNIHDEQEIFDKITVKIIRQLILKNGIKISIFNDKNTDFSNFNSIINEEIKFQRKNLDLLKNI